MNGMTRRDLIKRGSAAALGIATLGILGCSPSNEDNGSNPTSSIDWDSETDVVIVGGGAAGLMAAIEIHDAGSEAIVLEANIVAGGDGALNGGIMAAHNSRAFRASEFANQVTEQDVINWWYTVDNGKIGEFNEEIASVVIERSGEALDRIEDLGVEYIEVGYEKDYTPLPVIHRVEGGGGTISRVMVDYLTQAGVKILLSTRGTELLLNNEGRVIGIAASSGSGKPINIKARKAVLLATGGYEANGDILGRYNHTLKGIGYKGCPTCLGDNFILGEKVGAIEHRLSNHPMMHPTVEYDGGGMWLWHTLQDGGICVGEKGTRIVNEDENYDDGTVTTKLLAVEREQENSYYYVITQLGPKTAWALDAFPNTTHYSADTIEDLATQLGLDPATLKNTVDTYNGYVAAGHDPDFGREEKLFALDTPPFYAVRCHVTAIMTPGGLVTDTEGRVLKWTTVGSEKDDLYAAVPGLYCAGMAAGWNAVGGWTVLMCYVMGMVAGRATAAETPWE